MVRKLGQIVICSLFLTLLVGILPDESYACSCAQRMSPEESYELYDAIFAGKVLSISDSEGRSGVQASFPSVDVKFEVQEFWKGNVDRIVTVNTADSPGLSCGFHFVEGQEYIVYAADQGGWLLTSACTRTSKLDTAIDDLAYLGSGTGYDDVAYDTGSNRRFPVDSLLRGIMIGATVALLISIFGFIIMKRRKK